MTSLWRAAWAIHGTAHTLTICIFILKTVRSMQRRFFVCVCACAHVCVCVFILHGYCVCCENYARLLFRARAQDPYTRQRAAGLALCLVYAYHLCVIYLRFWRTDERVCMLLYACQSASSADCLFLVNSCNSFSVCAWWRKGQPLYGLRVRTWAQRRSLSSPALNLSTEPSCCLCTCVHTRTHAHMLQSCLLC